MSFCRLREMVKGREACPLQSIGSQRVRHDWTTEQQQEARRWLNRPRKTLWRRAVTAFRQGWTGDSLPPGFTDLGRGVGYRLLPPSVEAAGIRCSYVSPLFLHGCCLFHLHPQKGEYTNHNPFNNGGGRLVPQVCDSLCHGVLHDTHVCAEAPSGNSASPLLCHVLSDVSPERATGLSLRFSSVTWGYGHLAYILLAKIK